MKIFFLFSDFAKMGGVERTLTDKANYLSRNGNDVTLVTYEQGEHPYAYPLLNRVKTIDLNCRYFTIYKYHFIRRELEKWKIKKKFKEALHNLIDKKQPDILVVTSYTHVYMKEIMSVRPKVKVIVESHVAASQETFKGNWCTAIRRRNYMRILKNCDLLISLTKGDAEYWRQFFPQVTTATNPVSFYCDNPQVIDKVPNRIIAVGRLHPQKRFDRLIEAFALITDKYPQWHMVIYGKGNLEESLKKLILQFGLGEKVQIHHPVSNIQIEYSRSQFFVLSSDYEGFPLVLLEAMACGLPVVSVNCPYGPSEIIENGKTGLLAKMDINDLAEKMAWMMTHDRERESMGKMAHVAAAAYKKEIVMKEWESAYLFDNNS